MKRYTVLVLCVAGLGVMPFLIGRFAGTRAASERSLARAAGIPLTVAEFPMPKVAAADDAAPDYLALAALLKRQPVTEAETKILRSFGGEKPRPDAKTLAEIRRILSAHRDALAIIHRAAAKPAAAFPVDLETSMNRAAEPVPIDAMKAASRLLRAEAASLAMDNRWDEAVRTQAMGFRVASHAASAPLIVAYLVGAGADKITLAGMTDTLKWSGSNERVCRSVIRAIESNRPHYDVPRALKGEYLAMSYGLRATRRDMGREKDAKMRLPRHIKLPDALKNENDPVPTAVFAYWDTEMLHYLRPLIAAAALPMPKRQAAVLRVEQQLPTNTANPLHAFAASMLPVFCDAPAIEVEAEAQRSVALAAADTQLVFARTGCCPASVSRIDPWTGRAIGYRRETDGFVVYSVGKTGAYDGRQRPGTSREAAFRWKRSGN